jgi:hypothetical protein
MTIVTLTLPEGVDNMIRACCLEKGVNVDPMTDADRQIFIAGLIWQWIAHFDAAVAAEFQQLNQAKN